MAKIFKYQFSLFITFLFTIILNAQESKRLDLTLYPEDFVTSHWKKINIASLDISEMAFVNWSSGGSNSISGLLRIEVQRNFKKDHLIWENSGVIRYGVNQQQNQNLRKTDDIIELKSLFGFRKTNDSNWYYSANFNFETQFTNGYNYSKSDSKKVSQFMAPAYMFLGIGTVYGEHIESFSAYISPLTLKSTFVLDQDLADAGSFGVTPAIYDTLGNKLTEGKNSREEIGILLTSSYENEVMENVTVKNMVSLYTDYLNDFGNMDIDWEINFKFKVNEYIHATLESHLKYDNDVKIVVANEDMPEETVIGGAKVQWKQLFGVGVSVNF